MRDKIFRLVVFLSLLSILFGVIGFWTQADEETDSSHWVGEMLPDRVRLSRAYCKLWPAHISFYLYPSGTYQPVRAVVYDVNFKLLTASPVYYILRGKGWHRFQFPDRVDSGDICWVGLASGYSHKPMGYRVSRKGSRIITAEMSVYDLKEELTPEDVIEVKYGELGWKL